MLVINNKALKLYFLILESFFLHFMNYKPYEIYIRSYIVNHKDGENEIDTTDIQNFINQT